MTNAWDNIGRQDKLVVEAEACQDWQAYKEALREMCRVARGEAIKRAAA